MNFLPKKGNKPYSLFLEKKSKKVPVKSYENTLILYNFRYDSQNFSYYNKNKHPTWFETTV